ETFWLSLWCTQHTDRRRLLRSLVTFVPVRAHIRRSPVASTRRWGAGADEPVAGTTGEQHADRRGFVHRSQANPERFLGVGASDDLGCDPGIATRCGLVLV